mmetsp:Transcript_31331/g.89937  ORF Transcript_31331/g.89937 Transcript_31331/m.89937 type:complete len:243 (-) Transcript_31331:1018-1746(-)
MSLVISSSSSCEAASSSLLARPRSRSTEELRTRTGADAGGGGGCMAVARRPAAVTVRLAPATATASGSSMPSASLDSSRGPKSPRKAASMSLASTPCAENSTISQRLVTGLRMATARKAAAEITDMGASSWGAQSGKAYCSVSPSTAPSVAPSATEGVSVPPAAPAPMDPAVTMAFKKSKTKKKLHVLSLCMATSAKARPFPRRLGKSWERMPSAKKTVGMARRILQSRLPSGLATCQVTEL